jgi:hypothetical protein
MRGRIGAGGLRDEKNKLARTRIRRPHPLSSNAPEYSRSSYQIAPETLALYSLLISTGNPVEIDGFVEGIPVAGYVDRRNLGAPHCHALSIDDTDEGCWELVSD